MNTDKHLEAAAAEAQAVIDRAHRQDFDPLEPLPLMSRKFLRAVLTMDSHSPLIRHDADGNARMSAWGYLLIALEMFF